MNIHVRHIRMLTASYSARDTHKGRDGGTLSLTDGSANIQVDDVVSAGRHTPMTKCQRGSELQHPRVPPPLSVTVCLAERSLSQEDQSPLCLMSPS